MTQASTEHTSYDQVPYASLAFPQTHPDRLATIARMFSLSPADIGRCRVLELGSASGGNLVPMAAALPGSEFVGIDLSRRQVDEAKDVIAALGLPNIRIDHASILDVDDSWGRFDYIICHGVYSWVDTEVQDKILAVCASNLAPDGVAYVSYNTYPGWHMREMVRHMMRYHAGQFDTPSEQVGQARALLAFLASASQGSGPYGELLNREVERLGRASDSYLFHEHLEQNNAPCYFHQFVERAEQAGLLYLSEASVAEMLTSHFPPHVAETLERISPDILHLEQYMDFVRNRQFRQTLLCHRELKPKRALTPDFMEDMLVSSQARPEGEPVDLTAGVRQVFTYGKQRADVSLPATKAALVRLMHAWPEAVPLRDLCAHAIADAGPFLGDTPPDETHRGLMGDLFGAVLYGMASLHTQAPRCTGRLSETPQALPLAAFQARSNTVLVNAHHEPVQLDIFAMEVLKLADGSRRGGEMVDELAGRFERGEMTYEEDGQPVHDLARVRPVLEKRVELAIASLTGNALLVA